MRLSGAGDARHDSPGGGRRAREGGAGPRAAPDPRAIVSSRADRWSCRICCPRSTAAATTRWAWRWCLRLSDAAARIERRPDVLRPRLAKYSPAVQQRGEALLASLSEDTAAQLKQARRRCWSRCATAIRGAASSSSTARRPPAARATRSAIRAERRSGSDVDRPDPHRARSARGDRLPKCQLRARLRARRRDDEERAGRRRPAARATSPRRSSCSPGPAGRDAHRQVHDREHGAGRPCR